MRVVNVMEPLSMVTVDEVTALVRRAICNHADLGPTIGRLFSEIAVGNPDADLEAAPCVYYREWKPDTCEIEVALPVSGMVGPAEGTFLKTYPACRAAMATHLGPYELLHEAWMKFYAQVQRAGLQPNGYPWDSYVSGPIEDPDPRNWVTELYIPIGPA